MALTYCGHQESLFGNNLHGLLLKVPALPGDHQDLNRAELLQNWLRERARLTRELGRPPSSQEIASCAELAQKQLRVLFEYLHDTSGQQLGPTVLGAGRSPATMDPLVNLLELMGELPDEAVALMLWRLGLSGEEPLSHVEIAQRFQKTPEEIVSLERAVWWFLRNKLCGASQN